MAEAKLPQARTRTNNGAMKFPAYVPEGVRSRYATISALPPSQPDQARADRLAGLSDGHSMEDAYGFLKKAIWAEAEKLQPMPTGEDLDRAFQYYADRFFDAAWCAGTDFDRYRDALKRAVDLNKRIGNVAEELAGLLREYHRTGLPGATGFSSVRALLEQSDVSGDPYRQLGWYALRGEVLKNTYAWSKAPYLDDILVKLAQISREFEPQESGFIAAAIGSQKRNAKTEYIRAFREFLKNEHRIELTPNIMNAMAKAATVALDDVDVTYDDVRKQCI